MELDPVGILRLVGLSQTTSLEIIPPRVALDQSPLAFLKSYRYSRSDVAILETSHCNQAGLVLEYRINKVTNPSSITTATIDETPLEVNVSYSIIEPHFAEILTTERVLRREDVYGYGPPSPVVHPEVLRLVSRIKGRVLDFGCGTGALLRELRNQGNECFGIELDRPAIRDSLKPDVKNFITLSDGGFPLPFPADHFDTVVASEVVEHISNYEEALMELIRVTRDQFIVTVPDIEGIPLGFRHGFVPWHLLESTHVNFFTQASLGALLKPHFKSIEFGRIGSTRLNDARLFVSLVAVCAKH